MSLVADLRVLYHMAFPPAGGDGHAGRLEAFYGPQAEAYDDFRRRLLHGREEMMRSLEIPEDAHLLDLGGGTGHNLTYLDGRWERLRRATVVDLCPSLLRVAEARARHEGWDKVRTVLADVTAFEPDDGPADVVTFSYALTMIPDWFAAIDLAYAVLKPGGTIGVADFYVSRKWPAPGRTRHGAWRRTFWPCWFGRDNVFLSPDILPYLQSRFETVRLEERLGTVPYLPGARVPYYVFLGRKS